MGITFHFGQKVMPKVLINIGALMDIPTATMVTGAKGETIYNGGLSQVTGIVGRGNTYKSTIMHYMILSAASKVNRVTPTAIATYDTEMNVSLDRLQSFANDFEGLPSDMFSGEGAMWSVVDKATMPGNTWAVELKKYADEKVKDKSASIKLAPFKDPYTKGTLEVVTPSFVEIDSLTEFEAESTVEMLSKDLDSSDTNTFAMKQGMFKSKFLSQLPLTANTSNLYIAVTAHVGDKIDMNASPYAPKAPKDLQFLKQTDNIKGVGTKFFFLTNQAWITHTPSVLKNQTTKGPEYPLGSDDSTEPDLNLVMLTMLRSKSGPSNNINYNLFLYPECKLARTTVRSKINNDPLLRRAINITAELLQLEIYSNDIKQQGLLCSPKELYEDIKKLGYDWNVLLNTRGYWTIDQYDNPVPFLSTVDLLKMRAGTYKPYWLEDTKNTKEKK